MERALPEIMEKLSRDKDTQLIVFAGAGVVAGTGVPQDWGKLLGDLAHASPGPPLDVSGANPRDYPRAAQQLYNRFGDETRYYDVLNGLLDYTETPWTAFHQAVLDGAPHVVTTNFDNTFDRALAAPGNDVDPQSLPDITVKALRRDRSFTFLHGKINRRAVVFRTDDYDKYYPTVSGASCCDRCLEDFMRHVYAEHLIVFVGVSFDDDYLEKLLKAFQQQSAAADAASRDFWPKARSKLSEIQHYALFPTPEWEAERASQSDPNAVLKEKREKARKKDVLLEALGIRTLRWKTIDEWVQWLTDLGMSYRHMRAKPNAGEPTHRLSAETVWQ